MTPPQDVCLYWAAMKVGLSTQTLTDNTLRTPDAIFGRQLAMWAMTYAKLPAKVIAQALGATPGSIIVRRHAINGRTQSCLFQQAAALGKSLKDPSPPRTNSQKRQNSADGPSSRSPTCQTERPSG